MAFDRRHERAERDDDRRRVRRGNVNLLGGRAVRHELFGLVSAELGDAFD